MSIAAQHQADETLDPIPLERRSCPREKARGVMTAALAADAGTGMLTRIELVDASDMGVGFVSPLRASVGTCVELYADDPRTAVYTGVVARCEPMPGGYRIGLKCRMRIAA